VKRPKGMAKTYLFCVIDFANGYTITYNQCLA
jgi:hypothetical protein